MSTHENVDQQPMEGNFENENSADLSASPVFDGQEYTLSESESVDFLNLSSYEEWKGEKPLNHLEAAKHSMSVPNFQSDQRKPVNQKLEGHPIGDFVEKASEQASGSSGQGSFRCNLEDNSDANRCRRPKDLDKYWVKALEQEVADQASGGNEKPETDATEVETDAPEVETDESKSNRLLKALIDQERRHIEERGLNANLFVTLANSYLFGGSNENLEASQNVDAGNANNEDINSEDAGSETDC